MVAQASETTGPHSPTRVLHLTDTLGSGGVERLIWDIVRFSDPARVRHRVAAFFPDGYFGPFVYADRLRSLGAYGESRDQTKETETQPQIPLARPTVINESTRAPETVPQPSQPDERFSSGTNGRRPFPGRLGERLPAGLNRHLKAIYSALISAWRTIRYSAPRKAAHHSRAAARMLKEYLRFRPDVVHVHGFYPFLYGIAFKLIFRCPVVHTVPSMFAQMVDQGTGWLPRQYRRWHRYVDAFFLDHAYRPELLSVGVPEEKLFSIRGGVDLQEAQRTAQAREQHRSEVRAKLGLPKDSLIALSVGRLDPSKGHQYAVEALPSVLETWPDFHWVVLGEGWKRAELRARLAELGVDEHAHLLGFVEDPCPFYAAADFYLRTMVFEGDNLSSFVALAMGLPVIGFDTGNASDIIPKVGNGISVPNRDAAALASAVKQVIELPDRGRAMGRRGADYCRAHLDVRQDIDGFVSTYLRLHQKKRGERAVTEPA